MTHPGASKPPRPPNQGRSECRHSQGTHQVSRLIQGGIRDSRGWGPRPRRAGLMCPVAPHCDPSGHGAISGLRPRPSRGPETLRDMKVHEKVHAGPTQVTCSCPWGRTSHLLSSGPLEGAPGHTVGQPAGDQSCSCGKTEGPNQAGWDWPGACPQGKSRGWPGAPTPRHQPQTHQPEMAGRPVPRSPCPCGTPWLSHVRTVARPLPSAPLCPGSPSHQWGPLPCGPGQQMEPLPALSLCPLLTCHPQVACVNSSLAGPCSCPCPGGLTALQSCPVGSRPRAGMGHASLLYAGGNEAQLSPG
ncbi:uncharacterized protein LOC125618086 [Marmota marmota marmota]|uniref:uncharacterized protein LOC125618086 n=1 Tax=Marmota marmota marmota TaxID=9994 RepID=UPI00209277FD|nr:uncharacterized protein LOC125618086 [Marmota marmota marmota]